ncbi:MAG: hypothetical protein ACI4MQ_01505 [Candidatus Coproplasma sp.]
MKKEVDINEVVELLKKVQLSPDLVTKEEKKKIKKYLKDPVTFMQAVGLMGSIPDMQVQDKTQDAISTEDIIAQNYIELSRFVLDRMRESGIKGLDEIKGLHARIDEDSFSIFALTTEPIEIDFAKYVSSDYPMYKEKWMEIEALQSDIITFGDKEKSFAKIKELIDTTY